jgi:hypothetical protein
VGDVVEEKRCQGKWTDEKHGTKNDEARQGLKERELRRTKTEGHERATRKRRARIRGCD